MNPLYVCSHFSNPQSPIRALLHLVDAQITCILVMTAIAKSPSTHAHAASDSAIYAAHSSSNSGSKFDQLVIRMFLVTLEGQACSRRLFEIEWMSQSGVEEVVALGPLELTIG
jgi:hypothetical protein